MQNPWERIGFWTWHELTAKSERKVVHKEKHFPQSGQHTAATKRPTTLAVPLEQYISSKGSL